MRTSRAVALVASIALFASVQAADLAASYTPTRSEWLKLAVQSAVLEQVATWQARVAFLVVVRPEERAVSVVVTLANGSPEPTTAAKARYLDAVRSIVRTTLDRYDWAKDLKLTVQFV